RQSQQLLEQRVPLSGGIGRLGITRAGKRLAPAASTINLLPLAGAAGLRHPVSAEEGIEGRAFVPDFREAVIADVPELQPGNGFRGMTGKYFPRRCHVERLASPTVHAGSWIAGVGVGH